MEIRAIQVESGRKGEDGQPSVGPVYRNILAKDGFPPPHPHMHTSWDVFRIAVEEFADTRMLGWREYKDGELGPYTWKNYKEVYEEVLDTGSALRHLGAQTGARVGIYGANCPQWIIVMEACNGYSFICVALYDTLGPEAIGYIIDHAEIDFVFIQDKKMKELLSSSCKSVNRLQSIISFTSVNSQEKEDATSMGMDVFFWKDFLQMGKEHRSVPLPPQPNDICTIMYTSGTSGNPKGVILTHESQTACLRGMDVFMDLFQDKLTSKDVYLSFLPLAHILDRMIEECFFHKGGSVGYFHGDLNNLRDDIMELKPTLFAGVPRVFERIYEGVSKALQELLPHRRMIFNLLYKHKLYWMKAGYSHKTASPLANFLAFRKVNDRLGGRIRLIISGGAPLNPEIEEFFRVTSCAFVTQGYGLTETCGISTVGFPDDISMFSTVGVPSTYTEIRLEEVPEMGYDPLAVPSRGEICIRGKTLFSGYYKDPELTMEAMKGGWFHTGDIGEMRPDGVLKIIDRKKNIFKLSQGEYVAVEYLEKLYSSAPIVDDIWVYGDSFRSMLVAVVIANEDITKKWACSNGHAGSFTELCSLDELKKYVISELKVVAEKYKLKGFEQIKAVAIDPMPFNIERDLVTPTMKKRRSQMLKYYQACVDKLYEDLGVGNNISNYRQHENMTF